MLICLKLDTGPALKSVSAELLQRYIQWLLAGIRIGADYGRYHFEGIDTLSNER